MNRLVRRRQRDAWLAGCRLPVAMLIQLGDSDHAALPPAALPESPVCIRPRQTAAVRMI